MTSTELDTYASNGSQPVPYSPPPADPTGGRLVAWASSLFAAKQIADALCQTTFAPTHFRGKPDDGAAAIMFGDEIGLSPTQALRSIYVISGTPSLYARQMVAIVMHHGHEVWTEEKSDAKVTVSGRRRGSTHVHSETWTTSRARQAGYLNNKKYASDPQAMLYARAAADICRQIAPDALAGLAYTVEELEADDQPTTTTRRAEPTTTARRKAATTQPEPDLDPPANVDTATGEVADTPPNSSPEAPSASGEDPVDIKAITKAQLTKLAVCFGQVGITSRENRLDYAMKLIGHPLETSKDLTRDEANRLIDALEEDARDPFPPEPPLDGPS